MWIMDKSNVCFEDELSKSTIHFLLLYVKSLHHQFLVIATSQKVISFLRWYCCFSAKKFWSNGSHIRFQANSHFNLECQKLLPSNHYRCCHTMQDLQMTRRTLFLNRAEDWKVLLVRFWKKNILSQIILLTSFSLDRVHISLIFYFEASDSVAQTETAIVDPKN